MRCNDLPEFVPRFKFHAHSADVRGIKCVGVDQIFTASRDFTANLIECTADNTVSLVKKFVGHGSFVAVVCLLPLSARFQKCLLLTGGYDSVILAHDCETFEVVFKLTQHSQAVSAICAFKDGSRFVSGSLDTSAIVWKFETCLYTLKQHDLAVWSVLHVEGIDAVFTASADSTINMWQGEKLIKSFTGHKGPVRKVKEVPGQNKIISCSNDCSVKCWSISQGVCLFTYSEHAHFVYDIAYLPLYDLVASVGEDKCVNFWSLADSGKMVQAFVLAVESIWCVDVFDDGDVIVGTDTGDIFALTRSSACKAGDAALKEFGENLGRSKASLQHESADRTFNFSIDIEDNKPPLKLQYSSTQNPWQVAQDFASHNNLAIEHVSTIANFIIQNTGQKDNSDIKSPKGKSAESLSRASSLFKENSFVPLVDFIVLEKFDASAIFSKVKEFNASCQHLDREQRLNDEEILFLKAHFCPDFCVSKELLRIACKLIYWKCEECLFPCLDFIRVIFTKNDLPQVESFNSVKDALIQRILFLTTSSSSRNEALAFKCFVNSFRSFPRDSPFFADIANVLLPGVDHLRDSQMHLNLSLQLAISTLLLNFSIFLKSDVTHPIPADTTLTLISSFSTLLDRKDRLNAESLFRCLSAFANFVWGDEDALRLSLSPKHRMMEHTRAIFADSSSLPKIHNLSRFLLNIFDNFLQLVK